MQAELLDFGLIDRWGAADQAMPVQTISSVMSKSRLARLLIRNT